MEYYKAFSTAVYKHPKQHNFICEKSGFFPPPEKMLTAASPSQFLS